MYRRVAGLKAACGFDVAAFLVDFFEAGEASTDGSSARPGTPTSAPLK